MLKSLLTKTASWMASLELELLWAIAIGFTAITAFNLGYAFGKHLALG